jgi:hypothetical protein
VPCDPFSFEFEAPWSLMTIAASKDRNAPDYGACASFTRGFGEEKIAVGKIGIILCRERVSQYIYVYSIRYTF